MEDEKIVELFFQRSEEALRELDKKYGRLCHRLSHNILDSWPDAKECVNDAWLGVWNAIPPARPNPLQAYVCRIVRNLSLKRYYRENAAKRSGAYTVAMEELEEYLPASNTVEAEIEAKELTRVIESFLDRLTVENRVIFMRRYWFSDTYADIADRMGISEKNVSVRLTRTRREMRKYLSERGIMV